MDPVGRASKQARRASKESVALGEPKNKLVEPWSQLGGPQTQLRGPRSQLGGSQSWLGGPWSQLGGPWSHLGGPWSHLGGPAERPKGGGRTERDRQRDRTERPFPVLTKVLVKLEVVEVMGFGRRQERKMVSAVRNGRLEDGDGKPKPSRRQMTFGHENAHEQRACEAMSKMIQRIPAVAHFKGPYDNSTAKKISNAKV